jgi:hypothetical protein
MDLGPDKVGDAVGNGTVDDEELEIVGEDVGLQLVKTSGLRQLVKLWD